MAEKATKQRANTENTRTNGAKADTTSSKGVKSGSFPADRTADLAGNVNNALVDQEGSKEPTYAGPGRPDLGERLAAKAVEDDDGQGGVGPVKIVEENGVRSAVSTAADVPKGNGKVYTDPRINPRDTNAPDAGLTPDGVRVAK